MGDLVVDGRPVTPVRHRRPVARVLAGLGIVALAGLVVACSGGARRATVTASPTPAPRAVDTYTSMDTGFAESLPTDDAGMAQSLDGMASYVPGGSPIVRIDLKWQHVQECRACALQWSQVDAQVNAIVAHGMRVLLILDYAPAWANGWHQESTWFPVDDADWSSIVSRTVAHFGDTVRLYEVWNEPNMVGDFANYASDPLARYWELVRLAYRNIHAACRSCLVLAGGSAAGTEGAATEPAAWLDWAYANGYGGFFDAVAYHPYVPAGGPEVSACGSRWLNMIGPPGEDPPCGELAAVHSVLVRHGDAAKKIWATEWGAPVPASSRPAALATVRDNLVRTVQMWRGLNYTGPLILYSYRDACAEQNTSGCGYGVVTSSYTPKEPVFSDLAAALRYTYPRCVGSPDAPVVEQQRRTLPPGECLIRQESLTSTDGRFALTLRADGDLVLSRGTAALWSTGTTDGARLTNRPDGNLVLYRADGGIAWSTGTGGNGPSTLAVQGDGNLVLQADGGTRTTWNSATYGR